MNSTVEATVEATAEILTLAFPIVGPIINAINKIAKEIYQIYENAECNKEICQIITNRVKAAQYAIEKIGNLGDEEEKGYYLAFKRFENVLTNVKEFTKRVSKIKGYKRYFDANEVKSKYEKLTEEYDACMKDLHLAIDIANKNARDKESQIVNKSLEEIEETLKNFIQGTNYNFDLLNQKLDIVIQSQIAKPSNVKSISPNELTDPPAQHKNGIIKLYHTIEVECKEFEQYDSSLLAKLGELDSSNILRFYGLSHIDNLKVIVFEWAEYGSLKDLYNAYDIPWTRKIRIIRDICHGLVNLRNVNIFHHDIRCENVYVQHNLDPNLGNFKYARAIDAATKNLGLEIIIVRWMAPELIMKYKQRKYNENTYTSKCEIFSFGMLIWELCYEKLPYKDWDFVKISDYVLSGKREKLLRGKFDNPDDKQIQNKFIEIIEKMWQKIPQQRIEITKLYRKLEKLAMNYPISPFERQLLEDKKLDFEGEDNDDAPSFNFVMDLAKGIELHNQKDYKNAWKCFKENADLGNLSAKYWKGYYLYNGYDGIVEKDQTSAMELFKEASDNDHPYGYKVDGLWPLHISNARPRSCGIS
ncbi:kinase-like domain-containing protein [Gigaspora rosea]|uniref:Kinase-like domain-containing protein n=1 Tax=Gigaspora rosea TaxID=44941 RepID=A0A397V182_9GLOM|nr:kinase-like domain-containing protein [Gigaspora rosea]